MDEDHARRLRIAYAGIHPDSVATLLQTHGARGALSRITSGNGVSPRACDAALIPATDRMAQLTSLGIEVVFRGEVGYPARLAALPGTPDLLFVRGTIPQAPAVAVVGTRRCSAYGRNLAKAYGRAIAAAGWVLVSGLARGIDGAAHHGTVAHGGRGVAALGCGLDIAYPREHAALRDQLLATGGGIVSEYPPGTAPEAWRFPPRNRIISGMAQAVVVVEAAAKGGALITANTALEQGVAVFATPGDVDRESAVGCNQLIRDGAHPVLDPADLVAELELVLGEARRESRPRTEWAWQGITPDEMARGRAISVAEAAACLSRAELAGELTREGDRFYPAP